MRRAFALATDRERLANAVLNGALFPALGGLVPPGMPGHVAHIALPYDPQEARRLLAEAGYPGGRGLPRLKYVTQFWEEMFEFYPEEKETYMEESRKRDRRIERLRLRQKRLSIFRKAK